MAFDFIEIPKRTPKPREQGITMVLDKGLGYESAKDLIVCREWVDIVKLGWGTPLVFPESFLRKKIRLYKRNGIEVSNGGTLLELAYTQDRIDEFFEKAKRLGLTTIEVSNGKADIPVEEKAEIIKKAINYGFRIYSEIGKKDPQADAEFTLQRRVEEARNDLEAGATKVILEARESGTVGICDKSGNVKEDLVNGFVEKVGLRNIIFEAPKKNQQIWFILNFGNEVNLGNIKPADVISLETLRRGIRGDTFGRIS
jgi:phosphosulfolactate synthase